MNDIHLVDTNACRWKYRRINLRLRHSNNADKKFQQCKRLNFSNHPIRYSTETTTVIPSQSATTTVIRKGYHFLNDPMLLDMIQPQVGYTIKRCNNDVSFT